ncbi:hypothetical protein AC1031_020838 [Aphanomyces cochlioides]|nr:hypothetical protein AC1031_020838 [Aphanomyces cochlioides]
MKDVSFRLQLSFVKLTKTARMASNLDDFFAELTKIRRHLHANPELSFQEYKTQALVRDYLINQAQIPVEQISVSGKTGLVVDIFGPKEGPQPAEAVVRCHNFSFPFGNIHVKAGPLMAHGGLFNITISGPGGHGSAPHVTKDPIVAAGQIILAMQTITSRSLSPHDAAIVSICQVHGGEADNVIPSSVKLSGTVRDFSPSVEATIKQRELLLVVNISKCVRRHDCYR